MGFTVSELIDALHCIPSNKKITGLRIRTEDGYKAVRLEKIGDILYQTEASKFVERFIMKPSTKEI